MQKLKMKNSAPISQFKEWKLELAIAELLASTCFNIFSQMTKFNCNNSFLESALKLLDDGKFVFGDYSLYMGLEDIHNITGLPVDGLPIVCDNFDSEELVTSMLGCNDPFRQKTRNYVKKKW